MIYVKPVTVVVPARVLFGLTIPDCFNTVSNDAEVAYLICPFQEDDPSLIAVDTESMDQYRDLLVKLHLGENGLYAAPCFLQNDFGGWTPGGAYILLPLECGNKYDANCKLAICDVAVPLYDLWENPLDPQESSPDDLFSIDDTDTLPY